MAQKVEIVNIETKTLANLRAELKELKKQLEQMVIGSDEYNAALKEITDRQHELSSVTKSSVSDMEGSYNALTKELAELRKAWKATNDEAERNSLGAQMNEINNQLKELDASVGNFQRNVGNYSSALDGLDDKTASIAQSYDNAIAKTDKYTESTDQLEKTMMAFVASMSIAETALDLMGIEGEEAEEIMSTLQKVLAITTGFKAIAEGAKGFLQLTKTINLSTTALKGMKLALVSTGIGALVVAIGALIANWSDLKALLGFTDPEQKNIDALESLNEQIKILDDELLEHNQAALERYKIELDKAGNDAEKAAQAQERYNNAIKNAEYETLKKQLEAARRAHQQIEAEWRAADPGSEEAEKLAEDREKAYETVQKYENAIMAIEKAALDARVEQNKKAQDLINQRVKEWKADLERQKSEAASLLDEIKQIGESINPLSGLAKINKDYESYTAKLKEARKKNLISQKQYDEALIILQQQYNTRLQELQIEMSDNALMAIDEQNQLKLERLQKQYSDRAIKEMTEYNAELTRLSIAGDESGIYELNRQFLDSQIRALEELKAKLAEYGDAAKDIILDIDAQISDLNNEDQQLVADENNRRVESLNETLGILTETANAVGSAWSNVFSSIQDGISKVGSSINKGEKGWIKYGKIASAGLGVAADMLGTLASMQDTQTEEGFENSKKLSIAQATMSMLTGIVNVWTSVYDKSNAWMSPWIQTALGATLSAGLLATGMMQINQIKSTTFDGGGSGATASPSMTAIQAIQNPVDIVSPVQGASVEGEVQNQKIYVLETDITSTVNKVNVTQSEATF